MTISKLTAASLFVAAMLAVPALAQDVWDSDNDGVDDNSDNCTLVHNPSQADSDDDFFGNMCDGDFDNDGTVNAVDLGIMRANFFTGERITDMNADGITNAIDLGIFKTRFFETPGPTATNPDQPPCTCYFSGDCPSGMFCDYGPGGFTSEDHCVWRDIKPNNVVGAGCSIESDLTTGDWIPGICDGLCRSAAEGSPVGLENKAIVAEAIGLWADAMLRPSEQGGGPVDAALAAQASALQFSAPDTAMVLGRQTADALAMAAGEPFHNYFCHWEGHPEDENPPVVDLAGNDCLITAGELTVEALVSEIRSPGRAAVIMKGIVNACPNWQQMFGTQCDPGPGAMDCAVQFIEAQAHFLRTAPIGRAAPDAVDELLSRAAR